MLKHLEVSTPTSCLNHAEADEPIFTLRANDELAPDIVMKWALAYRAQKIQAQGEMTPKQISKYEEAIELANAMRAWKSSREVGAGVKSPGQIAYEEDVRRCPNYVGSGLPRNSWDQLSAFIKDNWELYPIPRNYGKSPGASS